MRTASSEYPSYWRDKPAELIDVRSARSVFATAPDRHFGDVQFGAAEGKYCSGPGASLLRSDERVEHDPPDLLCAAAGDGELGSPLQCLFA